VNVFACTQGCASGACGIGFFGAGTVNVANNAWPGSDTFNYVALPKVSGYETFCSADATCP
jgi:hypothetical protein